MFAFHKTFLFLLVVGLCYERSIGNPLCLPDTIDFATKVNQSSIVVYGKTMAKMMNEESDSIFHVFFQVDCILKGPATLRQINITNTGKTIFLRYLNVMKISFGLFQVVSKEKNFVKNFQLVVVMPSLFSNRIR